MKNFVRTTAFLTFLLSLALACTKEINLKTVVEFSLTEQHKAEGYINEDLPTTVTVVPEEILEEFSYSYFYSVSEGEGYFRDNAGQIFPQNENITLNPLSASMMYVGSKPGEHVVKITATDNYGFTEEVEIDYTLAEIPPVIWTATSPAKRIELGYSARVTVTFEKSEANTDTNYERSYRLTAGSGRLTELSEQAEVDLDGFQPIVPGTYQLDFIPDELGGMELSFDLRGDNGEEFTTILGFDVLEEMVDEVEPKINLIGDNPFTVQRGGNFKDPGATATDDVDGDISGNVTVDASEVDTSQVGTYQVTYNVSDSAGNMASEGIRTVEVIAGDNPQSTENDILAFALPGQKEASKFDERNHTVTVNVPFETDINIAPLVLTVSPDAIVTPSQAIQQDFKNPVPYVVKAENGEEQEWTVVVIVAKSNEKSIEQFSIDGVEGNVTATEVTITMPAGTVASALDPQTEFIGASISPSSGSTVDFTDPVIYTVTAEDGSTTDYKVIVTVEKSNEKEITRFGIDGVLGGFSGSTLTDITVTLPTGTDEKSLTPDIEHSGETISPQPGVQRDFTNPVAYTVAAENGTQKTFTVTVIVENDTPVASATASSNMVNTGQSINFSGSLSTDDIGIFSYDWDFGDGNSSTMSDPQHTYTSDNIYEVVLTVTDDGGLIDTVTLSITILPNEPPKAVVSSDKTSGPNILTVNFTGSGSSDDVGITGYLWDFGDGTTSAQINPSHDFAVTGNYDVQLAVSDGQYTVTDNISIRVDAFNRTTGRYSAPAGSLVTVNIKSIGKGKGSANVNAHGGSGQSGTEYVNLNTSWNDPGGGQSTLLDEAEDGFTMPSNGVVFFYGRHDEIINDSQTDIRINNDQVGPYSASPTILENLGVQE